MRRRTALRCARPDAELSAPSVHARSFALDERGAEEGCRGRSDLVRPALRLIVEVALEGEVESERYARGESEKAAYRNGYRTV
jgi:hypothetical protein